MNEYYKGLSVFCVKATLMAINRLNAGLGDPEDASRLIDRVVNLANTGVITKNQIDIIAQALDCEIDIPDPEPVVEQSVEIPSQSESIETNDPVDEYDDSDTNVYQDYGSTDSYTYDQNDEYNGDYNNGYY